MADRGVFLQQSIPDRSAPWRRAAVIPAVTPAARRELEHQNELRMVAPVTGLSAAQVRERIAAGRGGQARRAPTRSTARIVLAHLLTVFNLINSSVIAFLVFFYLRTGDERLLLDSVGIIVLTVANTVIAIINELRAVAKLRALEELRVSTVNVVRDGQLMKIDRSELVADDVVALHTGDQVMADGCVIVANHMEIDESPLTGESEPSAKREGDLLRAGTFCVYGGGYYRAELEPRGEASGADDHARVQEFRTSPLLKEINLVFIASLVLTVLLSAAELYRDMDGTGLGVEGVRKISTIATTVIPEGLMFFATITFAVGIYRIARHGALVQQINTLDALPLLEAVCIDKTGTLTRKSLHVVDVISFPGTCTTEECRALLGTFAALAAEPNATTRALEKFEPLPGCALVDELPFRPELKMSAIRFTDGRRERTLVLGAFDVMMGRLGPGECDRCQELYQRHHLPGYRTLLLLELEDVSGPLDAEVIGQATSRPTCIVAMADELRHEAADAVAMLERRGVHVKILSGDSVDVVASALRQIGRPADPAAIVTGETIEKLAPRERGELVARTDAFARLTPEQKHEIISALRGSGLRTGMIGDGVNDLPAMKEADVGIAMGEGSSATRETAAIVLLENRFGTIAETIDEGNRIINTVICVARLFLVKTVVVVLLSVLPWFTPVLYPLTPRRGALVSLLGVGLPSYLVATINRNATQVIGFKRQVFPFVLISSAVLVLGTLAAGWAASGHGMPESGVAAAMMAALTLLSIANYLSALLFEDPEGRRGYLRFSGLLLLLYLPFILTSVDIGPLGWLRAFYEIDPVPYELWPRLAPVILLSIAALLAFHMARTRWERRERGN